MPEGLVETAAERTSVPQAGFPGVAVAQVINNIDSTGGARVQLRLPWLPGYEPWARLAVPLAGPSRGAYAVPQVDDEVLVAFAGGDIREPYVLGSLWNGRDDPPASSPTDAVSKFMFRTPKGHEIEFDDLAQSITIETTSGHKLTMGMSSIELATSGGTASLKLDTQGNVELKGQVSLKLSAPQITIDGGTVDVTAKTVATLKGTASCKVEAPIVKIN